MSAPRHISTRRRLAGPMLALAAVACALAAPAPADAAWKITGRGWGHQIGMSQWGAYGYAQQGTGYQDILTHYYTGTTIGTVESSKVRVLLRGGSNSYSFKHGESACGRGLATKSTYKAVLSGSSVLLRNSSGTTLKNCGAKLIVKGAHSDAADGRTIRFLSESNTFRGDLEFSPRSDGGLRAVNAVALDNYVKGVVPNESPASWPQAALRAQAVAARSYGIATNKGKQHWDHYRDTRSQVYGGYETETTATNSAVEATALETVMYGGNVAITYFFSTSGGKTEDKDCAWGGASVPYLQGVDDPYDDASPVHTWTTTLTGAQMRSRLSGLYTGSFEGIDVLQRCDDVGGFSNRISRARVNGSGGSTVISGDTLRSRLGLRSAWASFDKI